MNDRTFIARGLLAGVCISLGGVIFLKVGGVAGAILFAFGLIAVVSMQFNLFTGKAQFVWGNAPEGQTRQGGYLWLIAILFLNVAACAAMGLLFSSPEMQETASSILDKRLAASPLKSGLLAIGCGFIMTLAVQNASKGKWLPLLFGIPAFILCGLPHCIADAFYIASLPAEYIMERSYDLLLFYPSIVAGNFLGCNAYRLVRKEEAALKESGSEVVVQEEVKEPAQASAPSDNRLR